MPLLAPYILTEYINVFRRTSYTTASRDSFNNPVYGETPSGWNQVYTNMKCRISYSAKDTRYAPTGELVVPTAELIYDPSAYTLQAQDHVVITQSPGWPVGTEYDIDSVYTSFYEQGIQMIGLAKIKIPII